MASCTTTRWASYSPQIKLTVTDGASDGDSVTWDWKLEYYAYSAANTNGSGRAYKAVIDGDTVTSGTFNIDGKKGWHTIKSGSKTIGRTHSAKSVKFSCSMDFDLTWSGTYCGTKSASGSVSMATQTSYKVTYNANGGSGAPAAQTKWYGDTLTLSSTKPTRTGHSFKGWGLSASDTTVDYAAGASYTKNASDTLYAIWTANTYKVTYNSNGGSGAPAAQTKTYGKTLTLSSTKPTRTNYTFKGWAKSANGAVAYAAGANYTTNASVTLYAIWELAYVKPRITNMTVNRCDSAGNLLANGTSVKITAKWSTDQAIKSIQVLYKKSSETTYRTTTVAATGTSGTVNAVVGGNIITLDASWNIQLVVTDQSGSSFLVKNIAGRHYVIHAKKGGKGIAFGKPSEVDGIADFEFTARFQKPPEFMIAGRSRKPIQMFAGDANGDGIQIGAGGTVVIGSGESATNFISGAGLGNNGGSEQTYLVSDNHIHFVTGMQGGYASRKEFRFSQDGDFNLPGQMNATGRINANGGITVNSTATFNSSMAIGGRITSNGGISLKYNQSFNGIYADGSQYQLINTNSSNNLTIGYGQVESKKGNTYVYGGNITRLTVPKGNVNVQDSDSTSTDIWFYPSGSGRAALGTTAHRWATIYSTVGNINTSDRREKKNIMPMGINPKARKMATVDTYRELFMKLIPVQYNFKENFDRVFYGLIAQDVIAALEELGIDENELNLVHHDFVEQTDEETGEKTGEIIETFGIAYTDLIPLLIHEVQCQKKELEDLKGKML